MNEITHPGPSYVPTWGKYPEIQKDFPYSDQCIESLRERLYEWYNIKLDN